MDKACALLALPTKENTIMAAAAPLPAFVVDKKGLAKLLERKGKAFAVTELVQNSWDEDTTQVDVMLEPVPGRTKNLWRLVVEDDNPEGFKDLRHAYTLFAESDKKDKATKRGRFNLGEKLVIAACETARITTTKGTVKFVGDRREHSATKRATGSIFEGLLRLTPDEVDGIHRTVQTLLPPQGTITTFNLTEIPQRAPVRSFVTALRTDLADSEGRLKPTVRKTTVEVFEPLPGETASIYEMGIPIVETSDRFHINVLQKVPLSLERDSVPPAYLRTVRVQTLNACYDLLSPDDAKQAWVTNALEDEHADADAVRAVFTGKFGAKAVIFDPSDPEANKIAAEQGYTVVPGGALPKAAWTQVKGSGAAKPAGQVTPSPNPHAGEDKLRLMQREHWPAYVTNIAVFAAGLGAYLLDADVEVRVANDPTWPFHATYGPRNHRKEGLLTLNIGRLGHRWFMEPGEHVLDLLIHEFAHHYCIDHLDRRYLDALSMLGAKSAMLALEDPGFYVILVRYDEPVAP